MDSRFSPRALAAFELFFRPWLRRRLHGVHLAGLPQRLEAGPLLLVANHVSWWDAFLLREVQRRLRPRAPVYTAMLRSELDRHPFFRWLGALGIEGQRPAAVAAALRALGRARAERDDLVLLFFPQGSIWPSFRRPLRFQRGVELFARQLAPATLLPVAIHLEPLTHPAPTAFLLAGEPMRLGEEGVEVHEVEAAVTAQLDRLLDHLARHGERAAQAWPPAAAEVAAGAGR